jgi:CHAT domain-containing protein/lipopolysaccharide biosynthesis regulator YciM
VKNRITILLMIFCGLFVHEAQGQKDSLWQSWSNTNNPAEQRLESLYEYMKLFHGKKHDSILFYGKVLQDYASANNNPFYYTQATYFIGRSRYKLGDYYQSVVNLTETVQYYTEVGDSSQMGFNYAYLGNAYKGLGDLDQAENYYRKSLDILSALGKKKATAQLYGSLARVYSNQERYFEATELFEKANRMLKEEEHEEGMAVTYNNLGSVYKKQGDLEKALDNYYKGLEIIERLDLTRIKGSAYIHIGNIYKDNGEIDSALFYYQKALENNVRIKNKRKIASSYSSIASVYKYSEVYDSALFYYNKSLQLNQEIGFKNGVITGYTSLAGVYARKGEYRKAITSSQNARKIIDESGILTNLDLANTQLYNNYHALNKMDSAEIYLKGLLDFRRKSLSMNYPLMSESQKELFFTTMHYDFELFYDFLYVNSESKEVLCQAYDNALLIKGMMLRSSTSMRQNILSSGDSELISEYYNWMALKGEISEAYMSGEEVGELESKADSLERILNKNSNAFADMSKAQNLSWEDIKNKLGDNDVAIEFIRFHHQPDITKLEYYPVYAALVVTNDTEQPKMVKLCNEFDLENTMSNFPGNHLTYVNKLYGKQGQMNPELYNLIWKPLESELLGIKKVYYSPDGLLRKIAFSALSDRDNNLLIDKYDLNLVNSTGNILKDESLDKVKDLSFTLYGGVEYSSDSTEKEVWSYLDGTKAEVENISYMLDKKKLNYKAFYGDKATEQTFKDVAANSDVLHVATHGYFFVNPEEVEENMVVEDEGELTFRGSDIPSGYSAFVKHPNPLMRSGLVLANANDVWSYNVPSQRDGVITAHEVAAIDMRSTQLVVLSACETGLGDIKGYEGVFGLQRSFKVAGVEHLVMSLWQVPDKETSEFMTLFYKELLKTSDIHKSFNRAQTSMREKYDPYYWAAFVLVN